MMTNHHQDSVNSDDRSAAEPEADLVESDRSEHAGNVSPVEAEASEQRLLFTPPIDIYETEDGLVLYADLPGVSPAGLNLQVQDNRLALFGRISSESEDEQVLHREYNLGDFLRSFILSGEVDHDRISAHLKNGVLRVELPRVSRTQPRRIEVSGE